MKRPRIFSLTALFALAGAMLQAAAWEEAKVGALPCVTFDSFCAFYEFTPPVPVPEKQPFEIKGAYGSLVLRVDNREITYNGHKLWLSYPLLRKDDGKCYFSRLDVIKTLDPLLRRVEAAPRRPVKGVIIDPGHGGTDEGARGRGGLFEKVLTLETANRLKDILTVQGIPARLTRNSDVYHLLEERADIANHNPDWIFVSLHYNSSSPSAHGIETYCLTPQYASSTADGSYQKRSDLEKQPGNVNDVLNVLLCDSVHEEIVKLYPEDGDRGFKRARFVVLRETKIPAILVEGGFMSNSTDRNMLAMSSYRQNLAEAVARGVKKYMALMNSPVGKAPLVIQPSTAKAPPKTSVKIAPADAGDHSTPPMDKVDRPDKSEQPATDGEGPNSTPPMDKPEQPAVDREGPNTTPPSDATGQAGDRYETRNPAFQPPMAVPLVPERGSESISAGSTLSGVEIKKPVVVPSFKEWARPVEASGTEPAVKEGQTNDSKPLEPATATPSGPAKAE